MELLANLEIPSEAPAWFKLFATQQNALVAHITQLRTEQEKQRSELDAIKLKMAQQNQVIGELREYCYTLKAESVREQNHSRINNCEIVGLPEHDEESLVDIMVSAAKLFGLQKFGRKDIAVIHRVNRFDNAAGKPRNIVCRFAGYDSKKAFMSAKSAYVEAKQSIWARDVGRGVGDGKVYFRNHYCPDSKVLYSKCWEFYDKNKWKKIYSYGGVIYMQKTDKSSPVAIRVAEDMAKLLG
jgi:hypothetical protein